MICALPAALIAGTWTTTSSFWNVLRLVLGRSVRNMMAVGRQGHSCSPFVSTIANSSIVQAIHSPGPPQGAGATTGRSPSTVVLGIWCPCLVSVIVVTSWHTHRPLWSGRSRHAGLTFLTFNNCCTDLQGYAVAREGPNREDQGPHSYCDQQLGQYAGSAGVST
jgi:hypothetical protein